jgi:hypothetical protein
LLFTLLLLAVQIHSIPEKNWNSDVTIFNPKYQNLEQKYVDTIMADRTTVFLRVQAVVLI